MEGKEQDGLWVKLLENDLIKGILSSWYFLDTLIHGHNRTHLIDVDEVHYSHIHLEVPVSRSQGSET